MSQLAIPRVSKINEMFCASINGFLVQTVGNKCLNPINPSLVFISNKEEFRNAVRDYS